MFGYVIANPDSLTPEELARYKSCYCGLCRELRIRHGSLSRLTLTYDMTFLVLLLESMPWPISTAWTTGATSTALSLGLRPPCSARPIWTRNAPGARNAPS